GPADADIMVSLKTGHRPTADYVRNLRLGLNRDFPGVTFYFLPADIVSETINFGLPAPYDIQVVGRDLTGNQQVAASIAEKIRHVRGAVDVRVQQPSNLPRFEFAIDRTKASELGLSERDIAGSVLLGLRRRARSGRRAQGAETHYCLGAKITTAWQFYRPSGPGADNELELPWLERWTPHGRRAHLFAARGKFSKLARSLYHSYCADW